MARHMIDRIRSPASYRSVLLSCAALLLLLASCTGNDDHPGDPSTSESESGPPGAVDYQAEYAAARAWDDPCSVLWSGAISSTAQPTDVRITQNGQNRYHGPLCFVAFDYVESGASTVFTWLVPFPDDHALDTAYASILETDHVTRAQEVIELTTPWIEQDQPAVLTNRFRNEYLAFIPADYFYLRFQIVNFPERLSEDTCYENRPDFPYEPPCVADLDRIAAFLEDTYLPALHEHLNGLDG
jgi:hypothetical protein